MSFADFFTNPQGFEGATKTVNGYQYIDQMTPFPSFFNPNGISNPNFTNLQRIQNALLGTELVRDKNGQYVYKPVKETPEEKQLRESILGSFQQGMKNLIDFGQHYAQVYGKQNENINAATDQMLKIAESYAANVGKDDTVGMSFAEKMKRAREYTTARIEGRYDEAQKELEGELGAEGNRSFSGSFTKASLLRNKMRDLAENDFYWMTQGEREMLQNQQMRIQNEMLGIARAYLPLEKQQELYNQTQQRQAMNLGMMANTLAPYMQYRQGLGTEMIGIGNVGLAATQAENQNLQQNFQNTLAKQADANALQQWQWGAKNDFNFQKAALNNQTRLGIFNAQTQRNLADEQIAVSSEKRKHPWKAALGVGISNFVRPLSRFFR